MLGIGWEAGSGGASKVARGGVIEKVTFNLIIE